MSNVFYYYFLVLFPICIKYLKCRPEIDKNTTIHTNNIRNYQFNLEFPAYGTQLVYIFKGLYFTDADYLITHGFDGFKEII